MSRDIFGDILRVKRQHPDHALLRPQIVDHPEPTAFATAGEAPSKLADTTGLWNDSPSFWILGESRLQLKIFIIRQILADKTRKESGLNEREHSSSIRQRRSSVQALTRSAPSFIEAEVQAATAGLDTSEEMIRMMDIPALDSALGGPPPEFLRGRERG